MWGPTSTLVAVTERGNDWICSDALIEPVREIMDLRSCRQRVLTDFSVVIINAKSLGKMFTVKFSYPNVSGPMEWRNLWRYLGLDKFWGKLQVEFQMILAFKWNLLPIPAWIGECGIFLLLRNWSQGRAPIRQILENAQKVRHGPCLPWCFCDRKWYLKRYLREINSFLYPHKKSPVIWIWLFFV